MTEEELRKEATTTVEWESTPMIDRPTFINGYIVGAEPREKRIEELEKENAELKGKYAHSAREAETYEQLIGKMKSALERWYNQHSDKSYTETFYEKLIADTEELLWINCEK